MLAELLSSFGVGLRLSIIASFLFAEYGQQANSTSQKSTLATTWLQWPPRNGIRKPFKSYLRKHIIPRGSKWVQKAVSEFAPLFEKNEPHDAGEFLF